ncbi:hypothetical protein PHLCEN_2v2277 [Hermanssonia centrifuga]|uniref:DUF6533 domain-containing protein n=1 Tax=Hermanssonia centrifuga TaxID=98765 RepID=A0A2R6RPJ2_9APHY|nr:hypothetical protein PHLCEN_2v2277 [Hermanssonia centrifuga]
MLKPYGIWSIELVWKSKWTSTKVLYLISRYLIVIELLLDAVYYFSSRITPEVSSITA